MAIGMTRGRRRGKDGRTLLALLHASAQDRPCGPCTACCTVFSIEALRKPAGIPCKAEVPGGGCARYATRPKECAVFLCAWKLHLVDTRPDLAGYVLKVGSPPGTMVAAEHRPGALDEARGDLDRLAWQFGVPVLLMRDGTFYDAVGPMTTEV